MKRALLLGSLVLLLVVMAGCAPGSNDLANSANEKGKVAGFWQGLWHGIIVPITFVISLFSRDVDMYEVHNNGNWYNLGFLLGVMIIFGSGGGGAATRRSRRRVSDAA